MALEAGRVLRSVPMPHLYLNKSYSQGKLRSVRADYVRPVAVLVRVVLLLVRVVAALVRGVALSTGSSARGTSSSDASASSSCPSRSSGGASSAAKYEYSFLVRGVAVGVVARIVRVVLRY